MKLYCFGHSGHSFKVASYLQLSGLEWTPVYVDFFHGETRSAEFRALNPMGEVPVLVDGDELLTQSGVILEALQERFGHFTPDDARENQRWIYWDNHKGSSLFGVTRFLANFLPEEKRNADVIAFHKGRVKASIAVLEQALTTRDFLAGTSVSTADLCCASYLFYPEDFGWDRKATPAIDAWLSRIEALDGWMHPYALMPSDQEMINRTPAAAKWHKEAAQ